MLLEMATAPLNLLSLGAQSAKRSEGSPGA